MADRSIPWRQRLVMLQGWRGDDVACVLRSGLAPRLAPALCSAGALTLVATRWRALALGLALSGLIGAATGRHPVDWLHRAWARRHGRAHLPPARAGRRFACALAAIWATATWALAAAGQPAAFVVLGLSLAAAAAVFTLFGLCLPSVLLTVLLGAERASAPHLGLRRPVTSTRRPAR